MKKTQLNWPEIRKRMELAGYGSPHALSAAAGLHKNTLYRTVEISLSTVDKLAHVLCCSSLDLLIYTDEPVVRTRRAGRKVESGL